MIEKKEVIQSGLAKRRWSDDVANNTLVHATSIKCDKEFILRLLLNCRAKKNHKLLMMLDSVLGGHTSEILRLVTGLSVNFTPKVYVLADTDERSEHKVREVEEDLNRKFDGKSKVSLL